MSGACDSNAEHETMQPKSKNTPKKSGKIVKQHICKFCSAIFPCFSKLLRHKGQVHNYENFKVNRVVMKCPETECCYSTVDKWALNRHHNISHQKTAKYSCAECNYVGSTADNLRRHTAIHVHTKYECVLCNSKFGSQSNLKRHVLNHSKKVSKHVPMLLLREVYDKGTGSKVAYWSNAYST